MKSSSTLASLAGLADIMAITMASISILAVPQYKEQFGILSVIFLGLAILMVVMTIRSCIKGD